MRILQGIILLGFILLGCVKVFPMDECRVSLAALASEIRERE